MYISSVLLIYSSDEKGRLFCLEFDVILDVSLAVFHLKPVQDTSIQFAMWVENYDIPGWWQSIMGTHGEHLSSINIPLSYAH